MQRKILLLCIALSLTSAFYARAQSGMQIQLQFGHSDAGFNYWYSSRDISVGLLFPVKSNWRVGAFYTQGINSDYTTEQVFPVIEMKSKVSEIGLISRYILLRSGKFQLYGQNVISLLSINNEDNPDEVPVFDGTSTEDISEHTISGSAPLLGFAVGAGYNINPNFRFNIIEFEFGFITSDLITIDRKMNFDFKTGFVMILGRAK